MNIDVLRKANLLNTKIQQINKLLAQIENKDMETNKEELFPITISAGMACSIDFGLQANLDDSHINRLETNVYNSIKNILTNYQIQLQKLFDELE